MLEALWSVEFFNPNGGISTGAGMVVLETGRILGGDSMYYYVGDYSVDGKKVTAKVRVTHYNWLPLSIFGNLTEFFLDLSGEIDQNSPKSFFLHGNISGQPNNQIVIKFTRRAELP